jgi:hypothetical protein
VLRRVPAEQSWLREEGHVRRPALGQPALKERWHAVAGRRVGDGYAGLAGEGVQHEFEVALLDA